VRSVLSRHAMSRQRRAAVQTAHAIEVQQHTAREAAHAHASGRSTSAVSRRPSRFQTPRAPPDSDVGARAAVGTQQHTGKRHSIALGVRLGVDHPARQLREARSVSDGQLREVEQVQLPIPRGCTPSPAAAPRARRPSSRPGAANPRRETAAAPATRRHPTHPRARAALVRAVRRHGQRAEGPWIDHHFNRRVYPGPGAEQTEGMRVAEAQPLDAYDAARDRGSASSSAGRVSLVAMQQSTATARLAVISGQRAAVFARSTAPCTSRRQPGGPRPRAGRGRPAAGCGSARIDGPRAPAARAGAARGQRAHRTHRALRLATAHPFGLVSAPGLGTHARLK